MSVGRLWPSGACAGKARLITAVGRVSSIISRPSSILGSEQVRPQRREIDEIVSDLLLGQTLDVRLGCLPGFDNDLGRLDQGLDLNKNRRFDLGCINPGSAGDASHAGDADEALPRGMGRAAFSAVVGLRARVESESGRR